MVRKQINGTTGCESSQELRPFVYFFTWTKSLDRSGTSLFAMAQHEMMGMWTFRCFPYKNNAKRSNSKANQICWTTWKANTKIRANVVMRNSLDGRISVFAPNATAVERIKTWTEQVFFISIASIQRPYDCRCCQWRRRAHNAMRFFPVLSSLFFAPDPTNFDGVSAGGGGQSNWK